MPMPPNNHKQIRAQYDDELYANALETIKADTVMTVSEFKQFEPLFMRPEHLSAADEHDYGKLSTKFYRTVNPYRPIHIVDDYTREEVLCLPKLYTELHSLTPDGQDAMLAFQDAHMHDDGNPNGMCAINQARATFNLAQAIGSSNLEVIKNIARAREEYKVGYGRAMRQISGEKVDVVSTTANKDVEKSKDAVPDNEDIDIDNLFSFVTTDSQ